MTNSANRCKCEMDSVVVASSGWKRKSNGRVTFSYPAKLPPRRHWKTGMGRILATVDDYDVPVVIFRTIRRI